MKDWKDEKLLTSVQCLVDEERRISIEVLRHLSEIHRRRLYARRGYSGMWDFMTKFLKYSEPEAQKRLSVMKLMQKFPEVDVWVEKGKVSFSTLAEVAKTSRRTGISVTKLMPVVVGKSFREARRALFELHQTKEYREHLRDLPGGFAELRLILDSQTRSEFEKLWGMRVHACGKLSNLFQDLVKLGLREFGNMTQSSLVTSQVKVPNSRGINKATRLKVWLRDGAKCVYCDPATGQKCEATSFLQFDHIQPRAHGGGNEAENLRLLCREHNLLAAADIFGLDNVGKKEPRGKQGPFT